MVQLLFVASIIALSFWYFSGEHVNNMFGKESGTPTTTEGYVSVLKQSGDIVHGAENKENKAIQDALK